MIKSFLKNSYNTLKSLYRIAKSEGICMKFPQRSSDDIFVIANGPSVKEQIAEYPNMCVNRDVMCMNYIANADFYEKLKPKYYIIADPNGFMPDDMCSKELVEGRTKGLDNIISKTLWEMYFFIPDFAKKNGAFHKKIAVNDNITVRVFPTTIFYGFEKIHYYFLKRGRVIPGMQNVVIPAVFLAIIMGYKNIYLFGVEHSWMHDIFCDDDNQLYLYDRHAYGVEKRLIYKDPYGKIRPSMYEQLMSTATAFKQHIELQKFAKYSGVNVYNVTPGSFLDVYERKRLESIL